MPRPTIMYSDILRRKQSPKKTRPVLPLKVMERKCIETNYPVLHTPTSSSPDSYIDEPLPLFPPGLPAKVSRNERGNDVNFPVYAEIHSPSPNNASTFDIYVNRKVSVESAYIPPPPLAKPYVDKFLGPKDTTASRKPDSATSTSLDTLPTFDPLASEPEGPTRSLPPRYRLPLSELLSCRKSEPNDTATTDSAIAQPSNATIPVSTQSPEYSLTGLFLQHGVEPSVYFLPPGLFDEDEDGEPYPTCSRNCLMRRSLIASPTAPRDYLDNNRRPSSAGSNSSRSSLISRTDYSLSPTISSASSAYSEDYSFYHRRKPAASKCCIIKFSSPDTIGVSLEAILSKRKNCLTDSNDEVMEDWGEKGKPASIHLIITRNGFKRVFPITIRCRCGVITRAELAYEIADTMQRYLVEAKTTKSKMDSERSISGLYLLSLRTDNQGLSWRATFADRRRTKTHDTWGNYAQRRR